MRVSGDVQSISRALQGPFARRKGQDFWGRTDDKLPGLQTGCELLSKLLKLAACVFACRREDVMLSHGFAISFGVSASPMRSEIWVITCYQYSITLRVQTGITFNLYILLPSQASSHMYDAI